MKTYLSSRRMSNRPLEVSIPISLYKRVHRARPVSIPRLWLLFGLLILLLIATHLAFSKMLRKGVIRDSALRQKRVELRYRRRFQGKILIRVDPLQVMIQLVTGWLELLLELLEGLLEWLLLVLHLIEGCWVLEIIGLLGWWYSGQEGCVCSGPNEGLLLSAPHHVVRILEVLLQKRLASSDLIAGWSKLVGRCELLVRARGCKGVE